MNGRLLRQVYWARRWYRELRRRGVSPAAARYYAWRWSRQGRH